MRKFPMYSFVLMLGCGASVANFIQNGPESFPPKPEGFEVVVYTEEPSRPYKIIGRVYAEKEANTALRWDNVDAADVIALLKKAGSQNGADAIFDIEMSTIEDRGRD